LKAGENPLKAKRQFRPSPPHPLRDIGMATLTTGMRRGEILGLRWDYIRLDNRLTILPITKKNTVRVIPINDTLHRFLSEMPEKTGYVFRNRNGAYVGDIKHSFTSACRKAGITNFRFHNLHYTYACYLAMRGVHIRVLCPSSAMIEQMEEKISLHF